MTHPATTYAAVALAKIRERLTRPAPLWVTGLCLALGIAAGFTLARSNPSKPEPELLTGTVTWSNTDTRLIAFEADGEPRDPNLGDTFYAVNPNDWQDIDGVFHGEGTYPTCLGGGGPETVILNHRRIQITAIRNVRYPRDNIALHVRCLG